MFVYEPLNGYRDERDAVELPWDAWGEEARTRGGSVADMFSESSRTAGPGRSPRPRLRFAVDQTRATRPRRAVRARSTPGSG